MIRQLWDTIDRSARTTIIADHVLMVASWPLPEHHRAHLVARAGARLRDSDA